jgi:sensor histidine kinase YesM
MLLNTNSIINEVRDIFMGKVSIIETNGKPVDMYNLINKHFYEKNIKKVNLKLIRIFTIHNFFDGFMKVYYSFELLDSNGKVIHGSWNILSTWKIHKYNRRWEIIDIYEAP